MRVALTGATGFIGYQAAVKLKQSGHDIVCLCRKSSNTKKLRALGIDIQSGDLCDPSFLNNALNNTEAICHAAAMVSDWGTVREILRTNVESTHALLNATLQAKVQRFIFISTTDVYGHTQKIPQNEEMPITPPHFNWYAESKRRAEKLVTASPIPWIILRPSTVVGPGSINVIGEIASALKSGSMLTINRGKSDAGLVSVNSVVEAIENSLRPATPTQQAFNIAQSHRITWSQYLQDIAQGLGIPFKTINLPYPIANGMACLMEHSYRALRNLTGLNARALLSRQAIQIMGLHQTFDPAKAQSLLGLSPGDSYETCLNNTLDWLRNSYFKNKFA